MGETLAKLPWPQAWTPLGTEAVGPRDTWPILQSRLVPRICQCEALPGSLRLASQVLLAVKLWSSGQPGSCMALDLPPTPMKWFLWTLSPPAVTTVVPSQSFPTLRTWSALGWLGWDEAPDLALGPGPSNLPAPFSLLSRFLVQSANIQLLDLPESSKAQHKVGAGMGSGVEAQALVGAQWGALLPSQGADVGFLPKTHISMSRTGFKRHTCSRMTGGRVHVGL